MLVFFQKYFIFLFVGAITALSQAPVHLIELSIIGFSSFFYCILKNKNINNYYAGHSFGFGYFLVSLCWIGNALLTDTSQFGIFLPLAYVGLPFGLGIFYGISVWLYHKIIQFYVGTNSNYIFHKYFIFVILLSLFDFLRGHILTGFPWNLPVYATASHPLFMQASYVLGIYVYNGLWLLFCVSFGLYFLNLKNIKLKLMAFQIVFISVIMGYGYWHIHYDKPKNANLNPEKNIMLRIVQPNIKQKLKWSEVERENNFQTLLSLSAKDLNPDYKYIFIWPETALPFNPEYDSNSAKKITDLLNTKHTLLTGKVRFVQNAPDVGGYKIYNSIFKFTPDNKITSVYDKVHLVPFGEYLPLRFILEKVGFTQINFFKSGFSEGKNFIPFTLSDTVSAGGLICYEAIFPRYSKIITHNKANLIINLTNDAWFGDSFGPYQHLTQTQFRAVENAIPIIRSANTGISAFIDENGRLRQALPLNEAGFLDIPLNLFLKESATLRLID